MGNTCDGVNENSIRLLTLVYMNKYGFALYLTHFKISIFPNINISIIFDSEFISEVKVLLSLLNVY
ncbi:MAG TPA: hypothetical protein DCX03_06365 [Bacteroidales bacterium]|jgi:hypothetical protein|nr:hypothetical protein [Bacteroidales bacterium]